MSYIPNTFVSDLVFKNSLLSRILDIEVDTMMKIENTILVGMYCCHQLHSLQCKEREAYRR